MLRENDSLSKEKETLYHEKLCLLKNKDLAEGQISTLNKSLEGLQKDLKDKENLVSPLTTLHSELLSNEDSYVRK